MNVNQYKRSTAVPSNSTWIVSRADDNSQYSLWALDLDSDTLFDRRMLSPSARLDPQRRLTSVGGYVLDWGLPAPGDEKPTFPYRLIQFDPTSGDPLGAAPIQTGAWDKKKFWGFYEQYGWDQDDSKNLQLIGMPSHVLAFLPSSARGTYSLWNFDPQPLSTGTPDPLPAACTPEDSFATINAGHQLLPMGNYVLDRVRETGEYKVWSFDPELTQPLSSPAVQEGKWDSIDGSHELLAIGELVLDWVPANNSYRLWGFDPQCADPLTGPISEGLLPDAITPRTTLFTVQTQVPIDSIRADYPGTIDFMRKKIKHVVFYMVESRSFDNVLGWLYEGGTKDVTFIGSDEAYAGASTDNYNLHGDEQVHVSKFKDGKLSTDWELSSPDQDPFHGTNDSLIQMFYKGASGYARRETPDMGGFVENNATDQVMLTLSPEQLPIMNGLARGFATSDAWFSSLPGGTDSNRGFSVTGSALNRLTTYEGGDAYKYFPYGQRRPSIWKVLWANGIRDWRIYYSVKWYSEVFSYQLYLKGQIPSVDGDTVDRVCSLDRFKEEARTGTLPAFSYLEPVWIAPSGTTSYHPGGDLVLGEKSLNEIYDALRNGPAWDQTMLVISVDKGGGIYDHVAPPYARKPWPNDNCDGFQYDLMGSRVPAIVVSPWIKEQTVFRSGQSTPFDATSFAATLLDWFGVPRARWGMGDRLQDAPTFESILTQSQPRTDAPVLVPPWDKNFPPEEER